MSSTFSRKSSSLLWFLHLSTLDQAFHPTICPVSPRPSAHLWQIALFTFEKDAPPCSEPVFYKLHLMALNSCAERDNENPSLSTHSQFCRPLSLSPPVDFFPEKRVPAYSAFCIHPPFPLLNLPHPNASSLRWASQTYAQYPRYRWTTDLYGSIMMLSVLFSGPFLIIPKIWFAF